MGKWGSVFLPRTSDSQEQITAIKGRLLYMQAADREDKSDTESALIAFTVCKGRLDMDGKCKWHQRCPVRFRKGLLPQRRQMKSSLRKRHFGEILKARWDLPTRDKGQTVAGSA